MTDPLRCLKCGSDQGWDGPVYGWLSYASIDAPVDEWLDFTCRSCGYTRRAPTKDAKPEVPPNRVIRDGDIPERRPDLIVTNPPPPLDVQGMRYGEKSFTPGSPDDPRLKKPRWRFWRRK